jgi:hypothetical protein
VKREYGFQAMTASSLPSSVPSLGPDAEDDDADSVFSQSDDCDADLLEESELETDDEMHVATDEEEIYEKTSRTRRPKRSMEFLGMKVCQYAFQGLLGIGGSTLNRLRKDESAFTQSRRPEKPKHPVFGFCLDGQRKWVGVLMFLWLTWNSCAETLPTALSMPRAQNEAPDSKDSDFSLRYISSYLNNLRKHDYDPTDLHAGPGTFEGPKRYLQHGSRTDLYWEYRAYCDAQREDPCCYGMFLRVANKLLKPGTRNSHLSFRKISQHGQCDTCFDLKRRIRQRKAGAKQELYRKYSTHILSQWLDRQIYWAHRTLSRAMFDQSRQLGIRQVL